MLTMLDIKAEVCGRVIDSDDLLDAAWFSRHVWDAYAHVITLTGGTWLNAYSTFATVSAVAEIALPSDVLLVKRLVDTSNRKVLHRLVERDEAYIDPDRSGSSPSIGYIPLDIRSIQVLPTSASTISAVSTSTADVSTVAPVLTVRGWSSTGLEIGETITINGTTPVASSLSYARYEVTKAEASIGTITLTSNAGAVTNVALAPWDIRRKFPWIRLCYKPSGAYNMRCDYIRKPLDVTRDGDAFEVPEFYEELIVLRFEEMARRFLGDNASADSIFMRCEKLAKDRMRFLDQKPDQFVTWAGGAVASSDDITNLFSFKDRL